MFFYNSISNSINNLFNSIMTPQQKAQELVEKMYVVHSHSASDITYYFAKECAIIAVDEILDLNLGLSNCDENNWNIDKFYLEVKKEIEKL